MRRLPQLFVCLLALSGCGPSPPDSSDPAKATELLTRFLEGWKSGQTLAEFQAANTDMTIADRHWKAGVKLQSYDAISPPGVSGYDVQFRVKLATIDAAGKPRTVDAVYNVSTTPKLVVVRNEGG